MSRILKIAIAVIGMALVVVGAIVVYRETDLLTGSLVILVGLMIAALLARRAAVREERAGMADWEQETMASAEAADDLFGDWNLTSPADARQDPSPAPRMTGSPSVAPPVPTQSNGHATPIPAGAEVPQPDDPSVAVSRPLRGPADEPQDTESLVASLFTDEAPAAAPAPEVEDPDPFGLDSFLPAPPDSLHPGPSAAPDAPAPSHLTPAPEPAMAGAALGHSSLIDWTGQGGRVDEHVRNSEDILRASEATALPSEGAAGGSELARLLAKVEARLRDYD